MRLAGRVAILLALWLLAWGEVSLANIVSGVVAAAVLLAVFTSGPPIVGRLRLRATGILRLTAYVLAQIVVSNIVVTRRTLSPRPATNGGVLAHRLRVPSELTVTLMSSIIALSPGTMTVDVDDPSSTIYVHFLDLPDIDEARASLVHLERLVVSAIDSEPVHRRQSRSEPS